MNVFVIQDPKEKNLQPATDYGALTVMLTGRETTAQATAKLAERLKHFTPEDFILLIGNPVFMAIAIMIASRVTREQRRQLQLLVWNREHYKYDLERIYA
jgi:hypothetical protein